MTNIPKQWAMNEPSVVSETVEGEAIVINLETGYYYSLVGISAELWDFLLNCGRTDMAHDWMVSRYDAQPDQLMAAWDEFLSELAREQLIREISLEVQTVDTPSMEGVSQKVFSTPQIHKFEDMKEMLLLDPIHDVAAGGWPNSPNSN